jgi:hypothetical protein
MLLNMFEVVVTVIGTPITKASANIQLTYFLALSTGMGTLFKARKSTCNVGGSLENSQCAVEDTPHSTQNGTDRGFE